jgi:hypothetical protein
VILSGLLPLPGVALRGAVTAPGLQQTSWIEGGRDLAEARGQADADRKRRHRSFLQAVMAHSLGLREAARSGRLLLRVSGGGVRKQLERREKAVIKDAEAEERERVKALKANNMDAYLELVRKSKNERIQFLLAQTDAYLESLSSLVSSQKEANKRFEAEAERAAAAAAEAAAADRAGGGGGGGMEEEGGGGAPASSAAATAASDVAAAAPPPPPCPTTTTARTWWARSWWRSPRC